MMSPRLACLSMLLREVIAVFGLASQTIDYRARFEGFLRQGRILPSPEIMARLHRQRSFAMATAGSAAEAVSLYEWIKNQPQSFTRSVFLDATGYQLHGAHDQLEGILIAGDVEGREYMFKLTPPGSVEVTFATQVTGMPFVVASSFKQAQQVDANGHQHRCEGLLMRKFDRSLTVRDFQCSASVLLHRCKAMITAINALHSANIVHMDIKKANIFVKEGLWFVGDFGSCVYHGEPVRETTEGCYVEPFSSIIGNPARWHHDWFALALVFESQLHVQGEPIDVSVAGYAERVLALISANCEVEELRELLIAMVSCHEQCMHFEGQDDFTVVTDRVIGPVL